MGAFFFVCVSLYWCLGFTQSVTGLELRMMPCVSGVTWVAAYKGPCCFLHVVHCGREGEFTHQVHVHIVKVVRE